MSCSTFIATTVQIIQNGVHTKGLNMDCQGICYSKHLDCTRFE